MARILMVALAALLFSMAPVLARADWPESGLPLGAGAGTQSLAALVADDAGGAYVAWSDAGTGLRVTHLGASGDVVACWPAGGALVTGGTYLGAAGDGAHGIILFFAATPVPDNGAGLRYRNFYGVRFTSDGQTPPGWSPTGNVFRTEQYSIMDDLGWEQVEVTHALPWSQGGSVFFMRWYRDPGNAGCHVIAIPAAGTTATRWDFSLGPAGNNFYTVDPDPAGGFIVARTAMDQVSTIRYSATGATLYQRIVHSGFVFTFGYALTLAPSQDALVWWTDPDFPGTWHSRVGQDLLPVAGWPGSDVSIPMTPLLADGQGGIFARVNVAGTNYVDRRTLESSVPASLWTAPLPLDHGGRMVSDAQAGYFDLWMPTGVTTTLRAAHYGGDGQLRTPWGPAGAVLTTTHVHGFASPRMIAGGSGVAYAAWDDLRSGDRDVYVQRLADDAPVPAQASLATASAFADRAELEWFVEGALGAPMVERRTAGAAWRSLGEASAVARDRWRFVDLDVVPGGQFEYRLTEAGIALAGSGAHVRIPVAAVLALRGFVANPARPGDAIEFTLAGGRPARLEMLDVAGRVLASEDVSHFGAGTHQVTLTAAALRPGVVFLRLCEGSHARTARAVCLQ
ncbi:MAG: hypothetical protein U0704_17975 [Candidatus Eisenbacteria bacterium]